VWLVVGLGNPGPKYARNRHNIGFMVVDELASRWRVDAFRAKFGGETATGEGAGDKVVLCKPQEYMNVSGRALQRTAAFYQVDPQHWIVVHDEIDLPLGALRVKVGGGHAGHNGLRSIVQETGTQDFIRVRCGVGRPSGPMNVADYVLGDFRGADETEAQILTKEAADAIELVLQKGPTAAMNKVNAAKQ
jgi:peptidyl-tRNA hydrolase, PTH1 family